jgi:acetyl esterase/lipase
MTWPDLLTRKRPEPSASIAYGKESMQLVDLWLPQGKGPHPTVLMVHGGCWQTEIADRRIMNWIADDLRRRGIAVWNIDYRGVDREGGGYPGTFLDAAAATDALRANADKYRLDISPLVAVGHSAGGHLALWLAARPAVSARARTLAISVDASGEAAAIEERVAKPLERALRGMTGIEALSSSIKAGQSTTSATFDTAEAAEAALRKLQPELARLSIRTAKISGPNPLIPRGSPVLGADPLPISTVVSLGGLPDLELAATPPGSGCGTEVIEKLIGPPTLSSRHVFADTSVPRLAPLGVKQVLINGMQDRIIPTAYAEAYAGPMRAAGDKVDVRMIDRTGHVELIAPESAAWAATVEEIRAALGMKGAR